MKKYYLFLMLVLAGGIVSCEEDETTDGTGKSVKLTRDLVLHYTFDDGSITDLTNNHFNGVATPGSTFVSDTPSGSGKALYLDGTQKQYVNIPYEVGADSLNFTASIWVKDFGTGPIFVNHGAYHFGNYGIGAPSVYITSDSKIRVYNGYAYETTYNQTMSFGIESYQSSGWHMITVTAANSVQTINVYVDGRLLDTLVGEHTRFVGNKMQIGGNAEGDFKAWADPMIVDNFRVYRRCLNAKEVQELYNEELKQ